MVIVLQNQTTAWYRGLIVEGSSFAGEQDQGYLVPAEVHARAAGPVLQPCVGQLQGGGLHPEVLVQTPDVRLHLRDLVLSLTDTQVSP